MKALTSFTSLLALGCASASLAASPSAATAGATALSVHQEPSPARLLMPGDRFEIAYRLDTPGGKRATGSLYIRTETTSRFERVALQASGGSLHARVPARLLRGKRLFYYAVIRAGGSSVRVPPGAPQAAWVLGHPAVVDLGTHRFGRTRQADAVVARAPAADVGFDRGAPGDVAGSGPSILMVGRDGSVWLDDKVKTRLLAWRPGHPDSAARTVPLASFFGEGGGYGDVALGPAGSFYVTRGAREGLSLYRLTTQGSVLWHERLAGGLGYNTGLRPGPDGTLYAVVGSSDFDRPSGETGWMPVASRVGRPLSLAAQRRGTLWGYEPLPRGLRLVAEQHVVHVDSGPREWRFAVLDSRDRVLRSWRVTSRTVIGGDFFTPRLVGNDPVVGLAVARPGALEHVVLRLAPGGTRTRFSLPVSIYGDYLFSDLTVGPDGALYRLATSPDTGVIISRYSL